MHCHPVSIQCAEVNGEERSCDDQQGQIAYGVARFAALIARNRAFVACLALREELFVCERCFPFSDDRPVQLCVGTVLEPLWLIRSCDHIRLESNLQQVYCSEHEREQRNRRHNGEVQTQDERGRLSLHRFFLPFDFHTHLSCCTSNDLHCRVDIFRVEVRHFGFCNFTQLGARDRS